jgi:hypothetical protein
VIEFVVKDVGQPTSVPADVAAAADDANMEVMLEGVPVSRVQELRSLRAVAGQVASVLDR